MDAVVERKGATKSRARPISQADRELEAMKAYLRKVTSSKKKSIEFLKDAGVLNRSGELAKQYRP